MPTLFQQSSLTFDTAKTQVARSAGAAGDTAMLGLAADCIVWAFQRWNTAFPWPWLIETVTLNGIAPFTVGGCSGSAGSVNVATVADFTVPKLVLPGDYVTTSGQGTDTNFPAETRVASVSSALITNTNPNLIGFGSQTLLFTRNDLALPSDFGRVYDVRLPISPRKLIYTDQRDYDIIRPMNQPTVPTHYSLFRRGGADGIGGFLTLLPPPNGAGQIILRYYRRLTQPAAGSDVLDIPQDFEYAFIAMAKSHFLADKGGQEARMAFWTTVAQAGLQRAISLAGPPPDELVGFQPDTGSFSPAWNPNARTDPNWTV